MPLSMYSVSAFCAFMSMCVCVSCDLILEVRMKYVPLHQNIVVSRVSLPACESFPRKKWNTKPFSPPVPPAFEFHVTHHEMLLLTTQQEKDEISGANH